MAIPQKSQNNKSPPPELEGKGSHKTAKEFAQATQGLKLPLRVRENMPVPGKK